MLSSPQQGQGRERAKLWKEMKAVPVGAMADRIFAGGA